MPEMSLDASRETKHVHLDIRSEGKHCWFPYDRAKGRGKPS